MSSSKLDDLCRSCGHPNRVHSNNNKLCWHRYPGGGPVGNWCDCLGYVPPASVSDPEVTPAPFQNNDTEIR